MNAIKSKYKLELDKTLYVKEKIEQKVQNKTHKRSRTAQSSKLYCGKHIKNNDYGKWNFNNSCYQPNDENEEDKQICKSFQTTFHAFASQKDCGLSNH